MLPAEPCALAAFRNQNWDETLVVWSGEFGRTPTTEVKSGRDHSPYGYSMWLAGGGVTGGHLHGATDDFGFRAVENPVHVHDLSATLLHQLSLDHEQLTWSQEFRDFRSASVTPRKSLRSV